MRRAALLPLLSLALVCGLPSGAPRGSAAAPADAAVAEATPGPGTDWIPLDDPRLLQLLRRIDAAGPYDVPDLGPRKDDRYARTPPDLAPYSGQEPFQRFFLEPTEYTGPGRAIPEPEHLDSVKLGFIGPIEATVSVATGGRSHEEALGVPMLHGAQLAVEEWNARGGYLRRHIPFELVVRNDNGLWGSSGNEIVRLAYGENVWGILGTIDGANSHIAIRVALKAEVVVINTGDTDPTFIETNIPWVVRDIGDDRQMAYLLVDVLYRKLGLQNVGILRASNRYGRFGVRELRDASRRLGRPVPVEMAYTLGTEDFSLQLERLRDAGVEAVVHWGDARECGLILKQMRRMGMRQPYFGCDRCVSDEFLDAAGPAAEGASFAFPWNPDRPDPKLARFRQAYRARFGDDPGTYAAHAYDGMNMLIWAVQAAGLNRARIRDVLANLPRPWPGVTGDIPLSACLDDAGDVYLAVRRDGAWHYEPGPAPAAGGAAALMPAAPFLDRRSERLQDAGPGRDDPDPAGLTAFRVGWFGPHDEGDPARVAFWDGARLAADEVSAEGGVRGLPLVLVPAWDDSPWSGGARQMVRLAYDEGVWAVVGSVDGAATHLAEQVVAKARLPLLSPGSTDASVSFAGVPWMFTLLAGDDAQAAAMAASLAGRDAAPLALLAGTDHDARAAAAAWRLALAREGMHPAADLSFDPGAPHAGEVARSALAAAPRTVIVLGSPRASGRIAAALRDAGYAGALVGGSNLGLPGFREAAGDAAEGAIFPLQRDPDGDAWETFSRAFRERYGRAPDAHAAAAYDAVRLVADAARRAGVNRARLRDALVSGGPWRGATGEIRFDALGRVERPVRLATLREGEAVPLPAAD